MKILLVNTLYAPNAVGGAEKSVQQLAESLVTRGHTPTVVSLSWNGERREDIVNGVSCKYLRIKNIYFPFDQPSYGKYLKPIWHLIDSRNLGVENEMLGLIDEMRPDVVHTNNLLGFSTTVWKAASSLGVPVVHTLRDYYLLCPRQTKFKAGKRCSRICKSCLPYAKIRCGSIENIQALVGVSKRILDLHINFLAGKTPSLTTHVYNGVDIESMNTERAQTPTRFAVGFLGRISAEKGLTNLLVALKSMPADIRLVIGGRLSGEEVQAYKTLAGDTEIEFLGFTKPESVLSRVHYLVVPSLWEEPFSRVVIESYAHGVPVIASRRGGLQEIVREGETGYLFEPDVDGDLAHVLKVAADSMSEWKKMSLACANYARSFSSEAIVERYLDIYTSAISLRRSDHCVDGGDESRDSDRSPL
jgi:glycosyltransferase involved in cell wall biosynthesis